MLVHTSDTQQKSRLWAAAISFVVGTVLMLLKFYAYRVTHSTAILSDALESIINVVTAGFSFFAIKAAQAPPDKAHPYGHGKIEFVTAVFTGGLITMAAGMIGYEAVQALVQHRVPHSLQDGLWIIGGAGVINALLGVFLLLRGRATKSIALVADGKHVLTDFVTSAGLIIGIALVQWTDLLWLDPVIALVMAAILAGTGIPLLKNAINGLIDAADDQLLQKISDSLERNRTEAVIGIHQMRAMRNGRSIHIDGHIVLPEYWTVQEAHDHTEKFEQRILTENDLDGEIEFHVDPCRMVYCKHCMVANCPIRKVSFQTRPPFTVDVLVSPVNLTEYGRP
jgi:cation diffusion facilitator family transporter